MAAGMAFTLAVILCVTTASQAHAQAPGPLSPVQSAVLNAHPHQTIVLRLGEAARLQGMRLAVSPAASQTPSVGGADKYKAVKWGALIGAIAGVAGGALQPTHSNGEYVLGNSRFTSALALGGIGAGVGALLGLAIEKSRQ